MYMYAPSMILSLSFRTKKGLVVILISGSHEFGRVWFVGGAYDYILYFTPSPPHTQNELVSFRGSLEEHQHMVESAQAEVEDKERSELEMKVEMELMREELERLRCSEDTLQSR